MRLCNGYHRHGATLGNRSFITLRWGGGGGVGGTSRIYLLRRRKSANVIKQLHDVMVLFFSSRSEGKFSDGEQLRECTAKILN